VPKLNFPFSHANPNSNKFIVDPFPGSHFPSNCGEFKKDKKETIKTQNILQCPQNSLLAQGVFP